jgi:hypothetical protein
VLGVPAFCLTTEALMAKPWPQSRFQAAKHLGLPAPGGRDLFSAGRQRTTLEDKSTIGLLRDRPDNRTT